jgi:hypothetical protein
MSGTNVCPPASMIEVQSASTVAPSQELKIHERLNHLRLPLQRGVGRLSIAATLIPTACVLCCRQQTIGPEIRICCICTLVFSDLVIEPFAENPNQRQATSGTRIII